MLAVSLRPVTPLDAAFLFALYRSTRALEMSAVPWPDADKERFLASQFNARETHYLGAFPGAENLVICFSESPIGRLYLDRRGLEVRIVDFALLPEYRAQGIGTKLVHGLQQEAANNRQKLVGSVDRFNRAVTFWRRLGFQIGESDALYLPMEWHPPSTTF